MSHTVPSTSPRSQVSHYILGHPRMSQHVPHRTQHKSQVPNHPLYLRTSQDVPTCPTPYPAQVPGPKSPIISQDIPGCPNMSPTIPSTSPRSQVSHYISGHPRMSQHVPHRTQHKSKVPSLPLYLRTSQDVPTCRTLYTAQVPGPKSPIIS